MVLWILGRADLVQVRPITDALGRPRKSADKRHRAGQPLLEQRRSVTSARNQTARAGRAGLHAIMAVHIDRLPA